MWTLHTSVKFGQTPDKQSPTSSSSSDKPKKSITKATVLKTADKKFVDAKCLEKKGYYATKQITCGKFGCVLETRNQNIVAKIGKIEPYEVQLSVFAASVGVSPDVYDAFSCPLSDTEKLQSTRGVAGVLILQRLGRSLFNVINDERHKLKDATRISKLLALAEKCVENGLLHSDLHQNNILEVTEVNEEKSFLDWRVIDWGTSARTVATIYIRVAEVHANQSMSTQEKVFEIRSVRYAVINRIVTEWSKLFNSAIANRADALTCIQRIEQLAEQKKDSIPFIAASLLNFDYRAHIEPRITVHRSFYSRLTNNDDNVEVDEFIAELHRGEEEAKMRGERFFLPSELDDDDDDDDADESSEFERSERS